MAMFTPWQGYDDGTWSDDPSPEPTWSPAPAPASPRFTTEPPTPYQALPSPSAPSSGSGSLDPNNVVADWMRSNNPQGHQDASYWTRRMAETGGLNAGNLDYWKGRFVEAPGTHVEGPSGGYGGTNAFSDPATKSWEALMNGLVSKMNTPYQPPGYDAMIGQLNKYFEQLQGPAYTPAQTDLLQTQALDPLEHQRQAARQQVIERMASHGVTPGSGIVEKALENVDQTFNTLRTQTQSQFATNAVGLDRQNAATAAQVGPQIAALQQGNYNYNLGNNQQAVTLARQVPDLAWSRLMGANSLIDPLNPAQYTSLLGGFQQQGNQNTNAYMEAMMRLLTGVFG